MAAVTPIKEHVGAFYKLSTDCAAHGTKEHIGEGRAAECAPWLRREVGPQQVLGAAVGGSAVPRHHLPPFRAQWHGRGWYS